MLRTPLLLPFSPPDLLMPWPKPLLKVVDELLVEPLPLLKLLP